MGIPPQPVSAAVVPDDQIEAAIRKACAGPESGGPTKTPGKAGGVWNQILANMPLLIQVFQAALAQLQANGTITINASPTTTP